MPLTPDERKLLQQQCRHHINGFHNPSPAEQFRALADWCEANQVEHDNYGSGELIEHFEQKIAGLLGKPAAVFMPSGVMAQLIAAQIWAEQAGLPRIGLHPTSHLALHEEQAHAALLGLHAVLVGNRLRPITAADLADVKQTLACLLIELPIREAGGQLPEWDELMALQALARQRQLPLHMDGARLWESRAYYGKSYADIAAGFDSVYVSTYKGLGGIAGAVLAGDESFVAQARLWQRRMGGTLVHQSPMIASAAMQLDARLALMDALYQRTCSLAHGLAGLPGLRVNPATPHTNMLHLYFDAEPEALLDRRDAIAKDSGIWLLNRMRPADVPGWSYTELYVGDRLLDINNATLIPLFAQLAQG